MSTLELGPQFIKVTFTGRASAGDITVTGLLPGDFPLYVYNSYTNYAQQVNNYFATVVTTADAYHQTYSGDLSGLPDFTAIFVRW